MAGERTRGPRANSSTYARGSPSARERRRAESPSWRSCWSFVRLSTEDSFLDCISDRLKGCTALCRPKIDDANSLADNSHNFYYFVLKKNVDVFLKHD